MMKGFSMRNLVLIAIALASGLMATGADLVLESGSAARANSLSMDQQIKIGEIITNERTTPLSNVNFSVSIGGIVPEQVLLRPLPLDVHQLAPQFVGYSFIVVEELIAIVEPHTRKIVEVLPRWRHQEGKP
ncbi:MAG TPA: DUF1236 domain-containing protein [Bradyrhizobium sp.]|nr:DUF1236 domain-containing protein [Bradyrhizobium sp.]